jgi:hypothetical protein
MRNVQTLAWAIILLGCLFCNPVSAESVWKQPVVDSYGNCTWRENGDGTVTASLIVNFKAAAPENMGGGTSLYSRPLTTLGYVTNGGIIFNGVDLFNTKEKINGVAMNTGFMVMNADWPGMIDYKTYSPSTDGNWHNPNAFPASVEMTFRKRKQLRAISVLAGNVSYNGRGFSQEQTGAAYLYPDSEGGGCQVAPPINPPEPPVTIRMSAPDWDLGELPVNRGEKRFTAAADQLCFTYSGSRGNGLDVVLDADSQNGVVDNQYQLKALADVTQVVPYSVVLDDGGTEFTLPNQAKSSIRLNSSGKTCFSPTFKTYVRPLLKKGDYSDVLTFTVVSKT